ncbi:hypothetical protein T265_10256 [Opisthorchis viverrini]|uniref:Uncharacterized protein n=1 Tax=Opisthorchis viverrini TaxID=6198 RepID=A0A074Z335_OPIVI|nr:hypothetical protein T265_10256 [Opisthorchis viverrini]KER21413.1 hypothetical protein T265_10256 [Opisthorchis viverrini]
MIHGVVKADNGEAKRWEFVVMMIHLPPCNLEYLALNPNFLLLLRPCCFLGYLEDLYKPPGPVQHIKTEILSNAAPYLTVARSPFVKDLLLYAHRRLCQRLLQLHGDLEQRLGQV